MTVLTEKELAKELRLSPWTVRRMRLQEGIPYFSVGKRIYYNLEAVFKWIESKTTQNTTTADEPFQYGKLRQIN